MNTRPGDIVIRNESYESDNDALKMVRIVVRHGRLNGSILDTMPYPRCTTFGERTAVIADREDDVDVFRVVNWFDKRWHPRDIHPCPVCGQTQCCPRCCRIEAGSDEQG